MTGMDDLVTWLRAQWDDDERVAQQMTAEPGGFYIEAETPDVNIMTVGAHVFRWTPKRVLDEVDAKRRILDRYERLRQPSPDADSAAMGRWGVLMNEYDLRILPAFALPYADRPGYREEWRP